MALFEGGRINHDEIGLNKNGSTFTASGVGAKTGSTVTVVEKGLDLLHQTVLTFKATPITVADDAGVAQYGGTGKIYTFPEGDILFLGAVINGSITMGTTGTFINTWSGVVALGSAAASTGATLTGTEATFQASTAVGPAVAKVAATPTASAAIVYSDGTAGAKDVYFNLAIADDATHTAGTGTFTGTITMSWINLGDHA